MRIRTIRTMNYPTLIRSLASSALAIWAATQTASAIEILDYVGVRAIIAGVGARELNPDDATGELRLNTLAEGERPLAGSFFDMDGPGPIAPFDLTPFVWRTFGNRSGLVGYNINDNASFFVNGIGIPGNHPMQAVLYDAVPGTQQWQSVGNWVPRQVTGVPDAGSTVSLFAASLTALVLVRGRGCGVAP